MAQFNYIAQPRGGDRTSGELEADDLQSAARQLRNQGLMILNLQEAGAVVVTEVDEQTEPVEAKSPILLDRIKKYLWVTNRDRVFFLRHLAVMTRAGISLTRALNLLSDQGEKLKLRRAIKTITGEVQTGMPLSESIGRQPVVAPKYAENIIASAEESGELAPGLDRIANRIEFWYQLRKKIIASMIYPAIVLVVAIIVDAILMFYFVPSFERFIGQSGKPVPPITQLLFDTSHFLRDNILSIILAFLLGLIGIVFALTRERGRRVLELVLLNFPILGKLAISSVMAQFSGLMAVMLRSGLSLIRAMGMVTAATHFRLFHDIFRDASDRIVAGQPLNQAIDDPLISKTTVGVIASGEEAGSLINAFEELEAFHTSLLEDQVGKITALVGPMLILFIGGVVAFVYAGLFMAIKNLV